MICLMRTYRKMFDENLKEKFINTCKFLAIISISLFDCWKKVFILMNRWVIGKNSMKPNYLQRSSYSKLNIQNITHADYAHEKGLVKIFNYKNLGQYHDLYVQSNTLLLAEVFEKFQNEYMNLILVVFLMHQD